MQNETISTENIPNLKVKKSFAKEYIIFVIILLTAFVMAYFVYPVWDWNYKAKESLRFFDWRVFRMTFGIAYILRFLILSISILIMKKEE